MEEAGSAEILLLAGGSTLGAVLLLLATSLAWNGISSGSLLAVTWVLIGAVLAWPVAEFYRKELWRTANLKLLIEAEKTTFGGMAALGLLSTSAFIQRFPLDGLLLLPFRIGGGALYAAVLPSRRLVGLEGRLMLLTAGQWTLQLIWVYLLSDILADIWHRFR